LAQLAEDSDSGHGADHHGGAAASAAEEVQLAAEQQHGIAARIRQLGSPVMKEVSQVIARVLKKPLDVETKTLLDHSLGQFPRPNMGIQAEALLLDTCRQHLPARVETLAAAVHWGSKAWLASMISQFRLQVELNKLQIVAVLQFRMYDSTQLLIGNNSEHRRVASPDIPTLGGNTAWPQLVGATGASSASLSTQTIKTKTKMSQADCSVGFLVKDVSSGKYSFVRTAISCPLQVADRETAEVLSFLLREQQYVPSLDDLSRQAMFSIFVSCSDLASANIKCEALDYESTKDMRCIGRAPPETCIYVSLCRFAESESAAPAISIPPSNLWRSNMRRRGWGEVLP
jgi:hypothetical protein